MSLHEYLSKISMKEQKLDVRINFSETFDKKASEIDIFHCFRLLLGRNPKVDEWTAHRWRKGQNLEDVVTGYLTSNEFKCRNLLKSKNDFEKIQLENFSMYISPSDIGTGHTLYTEKVYEPHVTRTLKNILKEGMVFLDIGANVGYFSLLASDIVGDSGRVISFEPFPENVKLLYLNSKLNCSTNITIYPLALGDDERLWFYGGQGSNGNISRIVDEMDVILSQTLVFSVSLDTFLKNIDRIDVIKIDIEGAEYLAMKGAEKLIDKFSPIIISEYYPAAIRAVSQISGTEYLSFFVEHGYDISVIDNNGSLIEFRNNVDGVNSYVEQQKTDHIDVCLTKRLGER